MYCAAAKKFGRNFLIVKSSEKQKILVEEYFQVCYINLLTEKRMKNGIYLMGCIIGIDGILIYVAFPSEFRGKAPVGCLDWGRLSVLINFKQFFSKPVI